MLERAEKRKIRVELRRLKKRGQPPEASLSARIHGRGDSGLTLALTMMASCSVRNPGSEVGIKPRRRPFSAAMKNPEHVLCFQQHRAKMRSPAELDD